MSSCEVTKLNINGIYTDECTQLNPRVKAFPSITHRKKLERSKHQFFPVKLSIKRLRFNNICCFERKKEYHVFGVGKSMVPLHRTHSHSRNGPKITEELLTLGGVIVMGVVVFIGVCLIGSVESFRSKFKVSK
jgi:hypothetical protein